jgi:hypothetical protein
MKKMYKQPKTEAFDLEGESLMQSAMNPMSSGGNASEKPENIYEGD